MFVTPAYAEETPAATAPAGQDAAATAAHGTTPAAGETHTETGVAHEAGHGSGVFPPFDTTTFPSQILWLVITFGLFFMLMKKVIVPRVGTIIDNRQDRISQDLDQAARLKAEADAAVETYEKELAAARAKGNEIASAARDAATDDDIIEFLHDLFSSLTPSQPNHYSLDFRKGFHTLLPHFSAPAGFLHAAERQIGIEDAETIDPDRSGCKPSAQSMRGRNIARPDAGSEPVTGMVRQRKNVIAFVERHDAKYRSLTTRNQSLTVAD